MRPDKTYCIDVHSLVCYVNVNVSFMHGFGTQKVPYCSFCVLRGIIILSDHRCQIRYRPRSFKLLLNTKDCEVMFRKLRKLYLKLM